MSQLTSSLYSIGGFLVFSGFSYHDIGKIATCSGRYVMEKILLPVQKNECNERNECRCLIYSIRGYYPNTTFPHNLYECVKFSPGPLGLWLEIIQPIVLTITDIVASQKPYFSSYWKECFDSSACDIFNLPCLQQYKKDHAVIHINKGKSFLNQFLHLHPDVFQNCLYYPCLTYQKTLNLLQPRKYCNDKLFHHVYCF